MIKNHEPNPQDGKYSSRYLSRKRVVYWDEPAYTVLTNARDISLHPGHLDNQGGEIMFYNVTPTLPKNGLTVAELFCGGGLMAVGLKEAGFDIIWANDVDKRAVEAYRHNIGDHVVLGDITKIDPDDIPDVDVIAGGPPCQDYSVAGKGAGENGERGRLVWTYLNIIEKKQPKAFIFENVKGLVGKRHRKTFDALIEKFNEIGYVVSWRVINAWDYGVAQKRERVFIVGVRKDLGFSFVFPEPDPADYRTQVLRDVIGDLPEPEKQDCGKFWMPKREYSYDQANRIQSWDKPSNTIPAHHNSGQPIHPGPMNHDPKPLSDRVMNKLNEGGYDTYLKKHPPAVPDEPSPTITSQWAKGAPNGLYFPNHDKYPILKTDKDIIPHLPEGAPGRLSAKLFPGIYWSNYHREHRDHPARTIPSEGPGKVHPTQPRRFTVRECLRIQSVPDWYVLPDSISLSAQYRIVGNGVPSRVAWYLGRALAEQLNAHLKKEDVA